MTTKTYTKLFCTVAGSDGLVDFDEAILDEEADIGDIVRCHLYTVTLDAESGVHHSDAWAPSAYRAARDVALSLLLAAETVPGYAYRAVVASRAAGAVAWEGDVVL